MSGLSDSDILVYRRGRPSPWLRFGVLLSSLVLTLITVLLLPLSELFSPRDEKNLTIRNVENINWVAPDEQRQIIPPAEPPPPKPKPDEPDPVAPELNEPSPESPPENPRIPIEFEFNLSNFESDFATNFAVSPTPVEAPSVAEAPKPPPVQKKEEKRPFKISEVDRPPRPAVRFPPRYPYRARTRGIEGCVWVRFKVTVGGNITGERIVSAEPEGVFENTVLEAIRRWRFEPGIKDGSPVETMVELPLRFVLE